MIFLNLIFSLSFSQYYQSTIGNADTTSIIYKATKAQAKIYSGKEYAESWRTILIDAYDKAYDNSSDHNSVDLGNTNKFVEQSGENFRNFFNLSLLISGVDLDRVSSIRLINKTINLDKTFPLNLKENETSIKLDNLYNPFQNIHPLNVIITWSDGSVSALTLVENDSYYSNDIELRITNE